MGNHRSARCAWQMLAQSTNQQAEETSGPFLKSVPGACVPLSCPLLPQLLPGLALHGISQKQAQGCSTLKWQPCAILIENHCPSKLASIIYSCVHLLLAHTADMYFVDQKFLTTLMILDRGQYDSSEWNSQVF